MVLIVPQIFIYLINDLFIYYLISFVQLIITILNFLSCPSSMVFILDTVHWITWSNEELLSWLLLCFYAAV